MCMAVSVRAQLTVPLRPGSTAAALPCSLPGDKRRVYFSQEKNRRRFVIFNIILTRNSAGRADVV